MSGTKSSPAVQFDSVIIEARDLVLSFGETPALRGADLSVQRGEVLAVMGPSGSGKSTLLYCLAGILVPDFGQVSFDGQRLDTMREERRSRLPSRVTASAVSGGDGPAGRMMAVIAVGAIYRYRVRGFTVGSCSSEELSSRQSTSTRPTSGASWRRGTPMSLSA